jgi:long-chain acyl-CoA synthetase
MTTTPPWFAQYEPGVPLTIDVPDMPVYRLLDDAAAAYPNRVALRMVLKYLRFGLAVESKATFRQVRDMTNRFAAALAALGVQKGDRVAIMLPNVPQYIIAYFGILKAGATVVNTNPTYTARELRYQLHDSGAVAIVTLTGLAARIEEVRGDTAIRHMILTDVIASLPKVWQLLAAAQVRKSGMMVDVPPAAHIHNMAELIRRHPAKPPQVTVAPDDVALFQYSGGTTGTPKAAMLTHRNLVANVHQIRPWLTSAVPGKEVMLGALPFFHVYGMTACLLYALSLGMEIVITPDPRQTELTMEIVERCGITFYPGVPAIYSAIIHHPSVGKYNLRTIKACVSGGAALPVEVAKQFMELTGGRLVEGYGLTECSPVVVAGRIQSENRPGAAGLPLPSTMIEIVSLTPDVNGEYPPVPQGEEGEIVVYGPQVMKGYWNQPEETAKTINRRGGLHTGDIARMDEDGYVFIVDRKKDLIIVSGYNVVPREVEEVLYMHPAVMEAVVAGIPHELRGEMIKAYVVLKPGAQATDDEIRAFCRKNLAPYKVPRAVEFRKQLPKSQVGKVVRRLLVEEEVAKIAEKKQRKSEPAPAQS